MTTRDKKSSLPALVPPPETQEPRAEKPDWDAFVAGWNARGDACYPQPIDGELIIAWRQFKATHQSAVEEPRAEQASESPQEGQP
jgi:hypothetical protein